MLSCLPAEYRLEQNHAIPYIAFVYGLCPNAARFGSANLAAATASINIGVFKH
jgi:hypothetical protein